MGCPAGLHHGAQPKRPPQVRDPADARAFSKWTTRELVRRSHRLERSLLRRGPQDSSRVRQRHRLAAVYQALSWQEYRLAVSYLEQAFALQQWWRNHERKRLGRAYRLHTARAKQWRWRAVRQWLEAVHTPGSQRYNRIDEVLWNAATTLLDSAKAEVRSGWPAQVQRRWNAGYALLERILRNHPRSRHIGRTLLIMGKTLNRQGRPEAAAAAFGKVLRGPQKSLHGLAHLGLGRCLVDVNRPRRALHHFILAHRAKGSSAHGHQIRKALFGAWLITGRAAEAHAFCQRVAPGNGAKTQATFLSLAAWARDHGRPGLATDLFRWAVRRWPRDPRRCKWWQAAVTGAIGLDHWHRAERLMRRAPGLLKSLGKRPGHGQGQGMKARTSAAKACRTRLETTLRNLATGLHAGGLGQRSLAKVNASRQAYAVYARMFPGTRRAYLMAAQHGDLLWSMIQQNLRSSGPTGRQLAVLFDRLTRRRRPGDMPDKEYRRHRVEAALVAVRGWLKVARLKSHRMMSLQHGLAGLRPCLRKRAALCQRWGPPSLKRRPFTADLRRLRRALLHYLKVAGRKDRYRGAVRYHLGHLHWQHNHFPEARMHLLTVAFKHTRDHREAARAAAFRVYHVLGAQGQRAAAERLLRRILAHKILMQDWTFRQKMQRLHTTLLWARADSLKRKKRWRQCGRLFETLATTNGTPKTIDAHVEAARCYRAAGQYGPAVKLLRRLITHHRQSRHTPMATLSVARIYHRVAMLKRAALWYERYVDRYPERKDAPATHLVALHIRTGLGGSYTLANQLKSFLGRYGVTHPSLAARARWLWIRSVRARGLRWRLPGLLRGWLKHHGRTGPAQLRLEATVLLAAFTWRRSCRVATTNGRCLATAVVFRPGSPPRQPLLGRVPKLLRATRRLLTRALKRPVAEPPRSRHARIFIQQAKRIRTAMGRYRACRRSSRCRSGRSSLKGAARARLRPTGERWRKSTPPAFQLRPTGFDHRPLRASPTPKK